MDFPAGPRTCSYNYGRIAQKHRMDLGLVFVDSTISGDGSDDIGRFFVTGHFDETNGECSWTKTYIGGHDVFYRGLGEGKGIWGLWELPSEWRLSHPAAGDEQGEQDHERAEEPAPVEAVAAGTLLGSMAPATATLGLRSINIRLMSSHLNQRLSPREMCLPSRVSGTNPS